MQGQATTIDNISEKVVGIDKMVPLLNGNKA